jgi:polyphenol oxidase
VVTLALPGLSQRATAADYPAPGGHGHVQAKPFAFGKEPPRRRKSFHDLSEAEVKLLCEAVGYMRDGKGQDHPLSISSPLQWDNLVALHAHHCTETDAGRLQVHWSWFFLPWHRAYLFFLERHLAHGIATILGRPKEADQFALPYWDWVTHKGIPNTRLREQKKTPSPFFGFDLSRDFDPSPAGQGDPIPFNLALFDGYRGPTIAKAEMKPDNEDIQGWKDYTQAIRDHYTHPEKIKSMLRNPNFCMFGGFPSINRQTGQGLLENDPHNTIHDWVGSRYGNNRDMGTLRYAALDPLCCLHHANIDCIWSLYPYTPDPDKPPSASDNCAASAAELKDWGDQRLEFLDTDGQPVYVTVRDTIKNMTNVTYASPEREAPALAVKGFEKPPQERSIAIAQQAARLTNKPVQFAPKEPAPLKVIEPDVRAEKPVAAVLEIEVKDFYYARRFQVRVFANKEDADQKTPLTDEHFVGSFQVLDCYAGRERGGAGKHVFLVDVSPGASNFFKVAPAGKPFVLTLVPGGTSSDQKTFYLNVTRITLRVYS